MGEAKAEARLAGGTPWLVRLDEVLKTLPDVVGRRVAQPLAHGSMSIRLYAPRGHDPQVPHEQDEVYIVMRGSGTFRRGDEVAAFAAGDVLFVPAGMVHRFETFTPDFATWVVFWGPKGGEAAVAAPSS